jgi:glycosyltransferase involved in cell wall biosynthesis
MRALQDGRTNILFVGRIAPNKRQDKLVETFARYLQLDPTARLILPGTFEKGDPFVSWLQELIAQLGLQSSVSLPGSVTEQQLAAYYRCSHLFLSLSEHEGFGVPLVEAMWFDIPVLARQTSAVPETLGEAALTFTEQETLAQIATLAHLLISEQELREKVVRAQRKQRFAFTTSAVVPILERVTHDLQGYSSGNVEAVAVR